MIPGPIHLHSPVLICGENLGNNKRSNVARHKVNTQAHLEGEARKKSCFGTDAEDAQNHKCSEIGDLPRSDTLTFETWKAIHAILHKHEDICIRSPVDLRIHLCM